MNHKLLLAIMCPLLLGAATPSTTQVISRATLLADAHVAEPVPLPVPRGAISLPDNWASAPLSVRLSQQPPADLSIRRVSHNDGRLYLEIYSATKSLSGTAQVNLGERNLGEQQVSGSLWLSLKPRIGKIIIQIAVPEMNKPIPLTAPTTLVEIRGRQIFLNGEVFLMKGATGSVKDQQEADVVHSLGLNTLRGGSAADTCQQYGFMNIASLNFGDAAPKGIFAADDAEFEPTIGKSLDWLREASPAAIASPNTLILQLGNERTGGGDAPGTKPLTTARRHASQLIAAARNFIKPLCPMLPDGYANQDLGFLTPDCMDVYMHNSYLHLDRYKFPWQDFLRWQGCLPPAGKDGQGRPFVNSEFGANHYLCQSYHGGPNNPFLEKIHAWNLPNRWAEFMENGTIGGSIYRLDDLDAPRDQGCSRFGILTHDLKPKLAFWDVRHMWRDFEIEPRGEQLLITYKRDYWARDCRLTITTPEEKISTVLEDFSPRSQHIVALESARSFRWRINFTTHSGLINQATGVWPIQEEENDFLDSLKTRDTYPFLRELFDTQVLTADGKPAPRTLAEMTGSDGLLPVVLRKRNGVTYLLLIMREDPNKDGPLHSGINIDVAFSGRVTKVDDMTGQPLPDAVDAESIPGGLRLKNIQAARIPGPIGKRSNTPFMLPIYRISP